MSHLPYTLLLALLLAAAISLEGDRSTRERVYAGIYWFCSAVFGVFACGWIMHWIHG
jgi:hypothetical protein